MTTPVTLPFSNNAISVFAYEGFDYVISNPNPVLYPTLLPVSNTSGLPSLYFTKIDNSFVRFSISDLSNNLTPSSFTESFRVTVTDGSLSLVSSNTVTIGPGRFLDGSGQTLSNNSYTFFKNEAITPIRLVAPSFTLSTPTSVPSLPPGLVFSNVASNIFNIQGTPIVPITNSNYQIIGIQSNGSKIVTTRFNMVVSNERLRVNLSGSPIIANMQIDTPITARVITSIPPATGGQVRYTYPALPDGIVVKDSSGVVAPFSTTSFIPTDPSYTMIIQGTPTIAAANSFRTVNADSNGLQYTVAATRFNPLPALSNTIPLTFQFAPTVLFDTPTLAPIYVGVPIDPSKNFFQAFTYFTTPGGVSNICNIFSPNLRSDLSLAYVPGSSRANLFGNNPTPAGIADYTIRAINSNGVQRDLSVSIAVQDDVVDFISPTPAADTCYTFILSRPLTSLKAGYYSSNIQFKAIAASGLPVVLDVSDALTGTGLSLDSNGIIVGLPSQVTPLTTLTVFADASGSPGLATRNIKYSIINDVFTFSDVSSSKFQFIENIPITPFQIPVQTLSERNVISYSQVGFPSGLSIDPVGIVSGIPTSSSPTAGNVAITATTGYATGVKDFSYNITPDSIVFVVPQSVYTYTDRDTVSIQVTGTAYSGTNVSNYAIDLPPSYGPTIGPTSGLIYGTWTDSIPPNAILPATFPITLTGEAGTIVGTQAVSFTASNIIQYTSFVWGSGRFYSSKDEGFSWVLNSNVSNTPTAFDIVIKNSNVDGNFILATASNSIYRSTNANGFTPILIGGVENDYQLVSSLAFKPGTTTWWCSGTRIIDGIRKANIIQSDDNALSWYPLTTLKNTATSAEMRARDAFADVTSPYLASGIALKYKDGVLMAGGGFGAGGSFFPTMLRSTDDGITWSKPTGIFGQETAYYNLDVSGMWIATGSSGYLSGFDFGYSSPTDTIKYSSDTGQTWSNATGGFNMFGYELVYANNVWLASGVDCVVTSPPQIFRFSMKYSTNGVSWSTVPGLPTIDFSFTTVSVAPIATYDFNVYTESDSTIANQVSPSSIGDASISSSTSNTYVTTDPANNYLTIFAPNNFPDLTGGITTPSIANVYSAEMWVKLDVNLPYGQYFVDFRSGLPNGFMIGTSATNGNTGASWVGQKIYYNADEVGIDSTLYNPVTWLYNTGWTQVVLVSSTPFTDDMTFFAASTEQQGMPISVAEISIYDVALTKDNIRSIYNSKRTRYNLPFLLPLLFAPLPIGSMNYDADFGGIWNVFTQTQDGSGTWVTRVYRNTDPSTPSWSQYDVSFSGIRASSDRRLVTYTRPQYLRPSDTRFAIITLDFGSGLGTGPIVSPSSSSFLLYQYVAMSLQLSATGSGPIYFFISAAALPPGLIFNPITNVISGKPAHTGTFTTTVYAKDSNGITAVNYTFTVNIPRIIRRQDGAGAYTSLLKQYTEVLGAQSGRDNRALPTQEARLGEFMSPVPVAVTTKTFNTNCANCGRQECIATNAIVDANGAFTVICDFIDANSGEVFDAGSAEGNICD